MAANASTHNPFPGESPGGKFQHFPWKPQLSFPLTLFKKYVCQLSPSPPPAVTSVIYEFRGKPPRGTAAVACLAGFLTAQ